MEKSGTMLRKQQHLSGQLKEIDQKVNDIKTYLRDMKNPHK
jgi:cytochrome c1